MASRNWLLTLNNPGEHYTTAEYLENIHTVLKARYTGGQLEQGEEGTPHIQFFMNFENSVRAACFKKHDKRIHYEKVMRTADKAEIYCLKEETRLEGPYEFGTKPVRRNNKHDWNTVLSDAKSGNIEKIPASIIV